MKPATAIKTQLLALACAIVFATTSPIAQAQRQLDVLYSFTGEADGSTPAGPLLVSTDFVTGTTAAGGTYGLGTVFSVERVAPNKEKVLYSFGSNPNDGIGPLGNLVQDMAGNLYGTTGEGGDPTCGSCGTVWKLDAHGKETILHNFTGAPDGRNPNAGLVQDAAGNLYGTTVSGGDNACLEGGSAGCGTVFKIDTKGKETVLHQFDGQAGDDGAIPGYGALVLKGSWLYGTTTLGGRHLAGTVFKVNATSGARKIVYSFDPTKKGGDGISPVGGLELVNDVFYGTTSQGGSSGWGTIFELDRSRETVLYNFPGQPGGAYPQSQLSAVGYSRYGMTYYGGNIKACPPYGCGVVFTFDVKTGKEKVLLHLDPIDGSLPWAGLTVVDEGGRTIFYGTATNGGLHGYGVVFQLGY